MSYYSGGITVHAPIVYDGGQRWHVTTSYSDVVVQCYVGGVLAAAAEPHDGDCWFNLPELGAYEAVHFLAADAADAQTDYFSAAFPSAHSNRIRVRVPQTIGGNLPGDAVKVYLGGAGDESADALAFAGPLYPAGKNTGFGMRFGDSFGFEGYNAPGFGSGFGHNFGFGCAFVAYTSDPKGPGTYPVKVTITDAAGNVSAAQETTVALSGCPAPATALAVDSYDSGADELVLSWTASPDL